MSALCEGVVPEGAKGLPPRFTGRRLGELAGAFRPLDDAPMPVALLDAEAITSNISVMARFCDERGILLAPHGKTTMAPQIFARQLDRGCWALTAATPAHLRVYRAFGVSRVLYANQIVEPVVAAWLASELREHSDLEVLCLVDSLEGIDIIASAMQAAEGRKIGVLIEAGQPGGRCGVRSVEEGVRLATAIARQPSLELRGVECFEGLIAEPDPARAWADVDQSLQLASELAAQIAADGFAEDLILSAGGSAFFDRVLSHFGDLRLALPHRVVLRSGCYVTQDGGYYDRMSPLASRSDAEPRLREAAEVWAAILSRPETDLIVVGAGRRDMPHDLGLPRLTHVRSVDGAVRPLTGEVVRLNDQHIALRIAPRDGARIGEHVRFSISHPCGLFDRWRYLPLVGAEGEVEDVVVTTF